jgi:uncharacterized flavoprotein (TIGR03862 family)
MNPITSRASAPHVAIIGGGPAGLMAAEGLVAAGAVVDLYDAMPSVGRKFLLAGKGGLNLTHSEPIEPFLSRYAQGAPAVAHWLSQFGPQEVRAWALGLGIDTFVGSSGKVFPAEMKAAPLLRAWLHRLRGAGVQFHMRHRWRGGLTHSGRADEVGDTDEAVQSWQIAFDTPLGPRSARADAVLLALGGASWPRLGSDGAWQPWLVGQGVDVAPLLPANCGFDVVGGWSAYLVERHAGAPLKSVGLRLAGTGGRSFSRVGEAVLTETGLEGNLVYAASALLRDEIAASGSAAIELDLLPHKDAVALTQALARGRGARSFANHLREHTGLHGAKAALLREGLDAAAWAALQANPAAMAARIKALPLRLGAARPIAEAISSAGGVRFEALTAGSMLVALPGVFCAGEMLDWDAPTGGYLLTACLASGYVAAGDVMAWWGGRGAAEK